MCGIIGCCGVEGAAGTLIKGLERLEYRGYDSAGIATINNGKIEIEKKKGRISALKNALESHRDYTGKIGIGHTRWATHGAPNDINAHPHISGKFALVHNGIIENYAQLKEQYLKLANFKSETDTEVIVQLLNRLYSTSCLDAIAKTVKLLEGSFALAILCEDEPDKLYCVRQGSPLLVGVGNGIFAASDITAISDMAEIFYRMDDGEIAEITESNVNFYNFELERVEKERCEFAFEDIKTDKGNCEHFMLKEIYEEPEAIRRTVDAYLTESTVELKLKIDKPEQIYIVACGSAYHAGLVGKKILSELLKIPVTVETASEFRYSNPLLNSKTPVIIISQSGETADSLAALREAKKLGSKTISIVNVANSSIAVESDFILYTKAGPEIAVATTKAYSAQLAALYLLAIYLAEKFGTAEQTELDKLKKELKELNKKVSLALDCEEQIKRLAEELKDIDHAYFIGRGLGYCAAAEGSLKLKEISYIHSEAYAAGEMKHGTISLIEKGTTVIAMNTQAELASKLQSNIDEVRARGAKVFAVTSGTDIKADETIITPALHPLLQTSTQIVPIQLLSYYIAKARGCDIDKPRNLAKSVTVE